MTHTFENIPRGIPGFVVPAVGATFSIDDTYIRVTEVVDQERDMVTIVGVKIRPGHGKLTVEWWAKLGVTVTCETYPTNDDFTVYEICPETDSTTNPLVKSSCLN